MTDATDTRRWAYDPIARPDLFDGVLHRRMIAYLLDLIGVSLIWLVACVLVFFFGLLTLGLGWLIYPVLWPAVALLYVATTLGGGRAATPGMAAMGLTLRLWYGPRPDSLVAVMHVLFFYAASIALTPFIHLIGLFTDRKRLLHDILLGVVVLDATALERGGRLY